MAGMDRSVLMNAFGSRHANTQLQPEESQLAECICSRPIQDILCQACGFIFTARARRQCKLHPRAIHLMDCGNCPRCKNTLLHEFRPSKEALEKSVQNADPCKSDIYPTGQYMSPSQKVSQKALRPKSPRDALLKGDRYNNTFGSIAASFLKSEENWDQQDDLGLNERR